MSTYRVVVKPKSLARIVGVDQHADEVVIEEAVGRINSEVSAGGAVWIQPADTKNYIIIPNHNIEAIFVEEVR